MRLTPSQPLFQGQAKSLNGKGRECGMIAMNDHAFPRFSSYQAIASFAQLSNERL